jgi:hypothetical protein
MKARPGDQLVVPIGSSVRGDVVLHQQCIPVRVRRDVARVPDAEEERVDRSRRPTPGWYRHDRIVVAQLTGLVATRGHLAQFHAAAGRRDRAVDMLLHLLADRQRILDPDDRALASTKHTGQRTCDQSRLAIQTSSGCIDAANDAESINRHLDDSLWLRRAHSIGHRHQTLNLLTYALGINGLAVHLHRQRHAPPVAA